MQKIRKQASKSGGGQNALSGGRPEKSARKNRRNARYSRELRGTPLSVDYRRWGKKNAGQWVN
ncbi:hypothetical protein TE10_22875 [Raoultella ornithinolytica]|nr:hypothetical protein TE10_22875 [Raoultella ornithinolytica]